MAQEIDVHELFQFVDTDKNGYIDKQELLAAYGQVIANHVFVEWNMKPEDHVINLFEISKFFDDRASSMTKKDFSEMIRKLKPVTARA